MDHVCDFFLWNRFSSHRPTNASPYQPATKRGTLEENRFLSPSTDAFGCTLATGHGTRRDVYTLVRVTAAIVLSSLIETTAAWSLSAAGLFSAYQGCARLMSREKNSIRLWIKWVESESSRPWKSGIWVESEMNHADFHLGLSWVKWILLESKISPSFFWRVNIS